MSNPSSNSDVVSGLEQEFQRLLFPPDALPKAGEQLSTGNNYPNADGYILSDHFNGSKTYAFDLPFMSERGLVTKLGALDIDEGPDSLPKALEIKACAEAMGLNAVIAFSGNKGFHVSIFSEPVLVEAMRAVLERIKIEVPFRGEIIPAKGTTRIKVAPCFHQVAGQVSYLLNDNEPLKIMTSRQDLLDILPDQLAILQGIRPNPASKIISLAQHFTNDVHKTDPAALIPDLRKLGGDLTPCMLKFRDMGGAASIGAFDKNSITLSTYCNSAGLSDQNADELAAWLVKHTNPDIETTKDTTAKQKHWKSTRETPSTQEPFSCALMLRAKKELQFDCSACLAAPEGIKHRFRIDSANSEPFNPAMMMPLIMSRRLLAYLLQSGTDISNISDKIFMNNTDRAIVHAFLNGCRDVSDIFRFWDSQPAKNRNLFSS